MALAEKFNAKGFSLIEITLVLFIMIAGVAIVGPNISSGRGTMQIKSAARDIASALRYARGQALISQQQVLLTIDLENNTYKVSSRGKLFHVPEEITLTLVTAQSEKTGEDEGSIRFFPDGSSTGGRVTLERDDNQWLVDINWLTGHVELINE